MYYVWLHNEVLFIRHLIKRNSNLNNNIRGHFILVRLHVKCL